MDELQDLYQEIILSHSRRPRGEGTLDPCDCSEEGYNPLCGDLVKITGRFDEQGNALEDLAFSGEGCAISRASADIMVSMLKGRSLEEVRERIGQVTGKLTQQEEPVVDLAVDGDLAALMGVRKFPARIKCATLAWHALEGALRAAGKAE